MAELVVRQVRSDIGTPHTQRAVLKGLGLRGVGSEVRVGNTPSFRGMIKKVLHLVTVQEGGTAVGAQMPPVGPKG
jgi:large subunit ribosomal protein L30